ncbi:hypothetical protein ACTXT7_005420 [Hymenolepis weldensis]
MRQAKRALDNERQLQEDKCISFQDLQEQVKSLSSALERAHIEAERRDACFRRLTEASAAAASKLGNSEPLISTSEHKALQEFLHFIRHQLRNSEEESLESLLPRTRDYMTKRDEECKHLKSEICDAKSKAQEYLKKAASLALVENEKKNLERDLSKLKLNNQNLQNEINTYRDWISSLVDKLKLEEAENDKEYPVLMDAISAHIKRIIFNEREKTAGQRSRLSQFQQKNKELRERNDALETQLAVLRQRLVELDGEEVRRNLSSAASLNRDRRKLTKQLKQSRDEICTLQSENSRLKNEMKNSSQSSLAAVGTNALLHAAETQAKQLQEKCIQLEKELRAIRHEKSQNEIGMEQKVDELQRKIESLEMDLGYTRRSESQLLEFREVVARLLNLDCTELGVPDFEIVHRLEHIVLALDAPDIQGLHKDSLMRSL